MRSPEDAVLLAMWQGRGSWESSTVDANELASYLEESDPRTVPVSPAQLDRVLADLRLGGLVELASRPLSMARGMELYRPYVLTDYASPVTPQTLAQRTIGCSSFLSRVSRSDSCRGHLASEPAA
jgi:hypothetical protein